MTRVKLIVAGLVLLVATFVGVRISQGSTSSPPGVAPEMWRPLAEGAGITIRPGQVAGHQDAIVGTLMIREGNRWRPVDLVPGVPGLVPAR